MEAIDLYMEDFSFTLVKGVPSSYFIYTGTDLTTGTLSLLAKRTGEQTYQTIGGVVLQGDFLGVNLTVPVALANSTFAPCDYTITHNGVPIISGKIALFNSGGDVDPDFYETVLDLIGGALTAGTNVSVTYDDVAGKIRIDGAAGGSGGSGESAYDIAVRNGFAGNELEWLASLKGPQGDPGPTGPAGPPGSDGIDGGGAGARTDVLLVDLNGPLPSTTYRAKKFLGHNETWQGMTLDALAAPTANVTATLEWVGYLHNPNPVPVTPPNPNISVTIKSGETRGASAKTFVTEENSIYRVTITGPTTEDTSLSLVLNVSPPPLDTANPEAPAADYVENALAIWSVTNQAGTEGQTVTALIDSDPVSPTFQLSQTTGGGMIYRADAFGTGVAGLQSPNVLADVGNAYYRTGGIVNGLPEMTFVIGLKIPTGATFGDQNVLGQELLARLSFAGSATQQPTRIPRILLSNNGTTWAVMSNSATTMSLDTPHFFALVVGGGRAKLFMDDLVTPIIDQPFTGTLGSNANPFGLFCLNSDGGYPTNGFVRAARVYQTALTQAQLQTIRDSDDFIMAPPPVVVEPPFSPVYINVGGGEVTADAKTFIADTGYQNGNVYSTATDPAAVALNDPRYLSHRYGSAGKLNYVIPANTRARVRWGALEPTFGSAGARVTETIANGGVTHRVDIYAETGARFAPVTKELVVDPVDGYVRFDLSATADNPIISWISVEPAPDAALSPLLPEPPAPGGGTVSATSFASNPFSPGVIPSGTGMLFFPSQDIIDTCGAAVHLTYGQYGVADNAPGMRTKFINILNNIGINRIRDGWGNGRAELNAWLKNECRPNVSQAGGGLELCMVQQPEWVGASLDSDDATMLAAARRLRDIYKSEGLVSVNPVRMWGEGTNETNSKPAGSRRWAQALRRAYDEDPATNGTNGPRVWQGTFSPADLYNFRNSGGFTNHGVATDLYFGNAHDYPGDQYMQTDQVANDVEAMFGGIIGNGPLLHTETGTTTNRLEKVHYVGLPEEVHGYFTLHLLAEQFTRQRYYGNKLSSRVYFYELMDKNEAENHESRFGLVRYDGSLKPGALALKRAIERWRDNGVRPDPVRIPVTVTGGNAQTKVMGLVHSDGRVFFSAWQQVRRFDGVNILNPASVNLTVTFPSVPTGVSLFRPVTSSTPTSVTPAQTMTFVSSPQEVTWWEISGINWRPLTKPYNVTTTSNSTDSITVNWSV